MGYGGFRRWSKIRASTSSLHGSPRAGAQIKANSGLRRVALELGGNGVTIVHSTQYRESRAAVRRNACGSRPKLHLGADLYVHRSLYEQIRRSRCREVKKLKLGDPLDPATDVVP